MRPIPIDKIAHTLAGAAIAAALLPFGLIPALLAIVAAAVGKELWDAQGHPRLKRPVLRAKTHKW